MQELDGEANAFSRVRQTQCEVEQSTTRCNTSTEREESKALKISWSCCFQRRKDGLMVEEELAELSKIWDGGHGT